MLHAHFDILHLVALVLLGELTLGTTLLYYMPLLLEMYVFLSTLF
jgi:hypothetical protein